MVLFEPFWQMRQKFDAKVMRISSIWVQENPFHNPYLYIGAFLCAEGVVLRGRMARRDSQTMTKSSPGAIS